jgi:FkbM family methyltransferase
MPKTHRTAAFAVDVMCRVTGRRNVVRVARFALHHAGFDFGYNYDMQLNGEFALQGWILNLVPRGQPVRVIQVGANVGVWTRQFLDSAESRGRLDDVDLHAFEPCAATFRQLAKALDNSPVSLQQVALSDHPGKATLHIAPETSKWNSLHDIPDRHTAEEDVSMTTLDDYTQRAGLDRIDLLKIDAEGNDFAVLKGASGLLRDGRIAVAQFEYNECWIPPRYYLRDAFSLLEPLGYRIGRLTHLGVELYPGWSPALETFRGPMYVACRQDFAERLPRVAERQSVAVAGYPLALRS